ncbi:MAG: 3-phosphoglycerate dehydrogenase, partial [Clostridia bacterium]|nr:3-phosphoglycerate dehydrogenase [Clostridia bacterium]
DNCAVMAAMELDAYLSCGNIKNSVNFPNLEMPMSGDKRVCILHANGSEVVAEATAAFGGAVVGMMSKTKGDNAYTVIDIKGDACACTVAKLESVQGVYRVRVI